MALRPEADAGSAGADADAPRDGHGMPEEKADDPKLAEYQEQLRGAVAEFEGVLAADIDSDHEATVDAVEGDAQAFPEALFPWLASMVEGSPQDLGDLAARVAHALDYDYCWFAERVAAAIPLIARRKGYGLLGVDDDCCLRGDRWEVDARELFDGNQRKAVYAARRARKLAGRKIKALAALVDALSKGRATARLESNLAAVMRDATTHRIRKEAEERKRSEKEAKSHDVDDVSDEEEEAAEEACLAEMAGYKEYLAKGDVDDEPSLTGLRLRIAGLSPGPRRAYERALAQLERAFEAKRLRDASDDYDQAPPAVEEPAAEEPAAEEPAAEAPAAPEPAAEEPAVEELAAPEPAAPEPAAEEPAVEELAAPEPAADAEATTFAAQRDELERRLEDAEDRATRLAAQRDELERRLEDAEDRATTFAAQRDEQVARASALARRLDDANAEAEALLERAEANAMGADAEAEDLAADASELERRLEDAKAEATRLAAQRDERAARASVLARRLDDAQLDLEDLEWRYTYTEDQVRELGVLEQHVQSLQQELASAKAEVEQEHATAAARATRVRRSLQEVARGELEAKQELAHANVKLRHCQEMLELSRTAAELARAKAEVAAQLMVATVAQPTHAPAPEYAGIHWRFN